MYYFPGIQEYTESGEPSRDIVKKRSMILVIQEYTEFGKTKREIGDEE